jgi:C-terminal processing protease CtpA/Prc
MAARAKKSNPAESRNSRPKPAKTKRASTGSPPAAKEQARPRTKEGATTGDVSVDSVPQEQGGEALLRGVLLQMERLVNLLENHVRALAPTQTGNAYGAGDARPVQPIATAVRVGPPGARLLRDFRATVQNLSPDERSQLIDAAIVMLENVYVHLPLKRAMHAVDPVQSLKILKLRSATMSERSFHDEMIGIFHSLRDLHTTYVLPAAYQDQVAFLPFVAEEYFDGSPPVRRYIVTKVAPDFSHQDFKPGVLVTYWNGTPIDCVVETNSEREAGSNENARHARGLDSLTLRPMALAAPPDEDWVVVGYEIENGQRRELRFDWQVFVPPPSPTGVNMKAAGAETAWFIGVDARTEAVRRARKALFHPEGVTTEKHMAAIAVRSGLPELAPGAASTGKSPPPASRIGLDYQTESVRRSKKALFFPEAIAKEQQMDAAVKAAAAAPEALPNVSLMPDVFDFSTIQHTKGPFGSIRIHTFDADEDAFVTEFIRISRLLPRNGLIIDVRGNPGGNILAGERLLQVLTPHPIDPERFHFINSGVTLELCGPDSALYELPRWADSIKLGLETGEMYSQGFPLQDVDEYNRLGQQYQGPVVLITDALCYSTTDIFAAGFQDHQIGAILGIHEHTGAGGANVWDYASLRQVLPNRFGLLPQGAAFRVALRRTTRVRRNAGVPVEDLGVKPDKVHFTTRNDLLHRNVDLIQAAALMLADARAYSLKGTVLGGQPRKVQVDGKNVTRVDIYSNGRPAGTADLVNGQATVEIPTWVEAGATVELRGYSGRTLVVEGRVSL